MRHQNAATFNPNTLSLPLDTLESSITQTEDEFIINKTKIFYGVLLVVAIGISWAGSTQLAQRVQVKTAVTVPPFALMWFTTSFKIFCGVPVLILHLKNSHAEYTGVTTPQSISEVSYSSHHKPRHHTNITEIFNAEEHPDSTNSLYGTSNSGLSHHYHHHTHSINVDYIIDDVTPNNIKTCLFYLLFYTLWTGANYCYLRALDSNSATIVTAIFSSNNMFIYVLSIVVLQELFSWIRMGAVVTAILGICLITLVDTDSQVVFIGSMLALLSSIFAAVYKVYFKKIFGSMNVWNVCRFLAFMGVFNALFMWIWIVVLDVTSLETLPRQPLNEWPWGLLVGTAVCGLTFDFLVNFGIVYTYPLFIALGIIIGIPFNLTADLMFNELVMSGSEMLGVVCICGGFMIIVVTDLTGGKATNASFRK